MSSSSRVIGRARMAGFTLVEVLAAIIVASLVLSALAQAFQAARIATKVPGEIVSAVSIAQSVALTRAGGASSDAGRVGRFTYERHAGPLQITPRHADIAPAVVVDNRQMPSNVGLSLRLVSVRVTTPSGRRIAFETVRLDGATR